MELVGLKKCNILGVNIDVTDMNNAVAFIEENLKDLRGDYICVSNVHTTVMAHDDDSYMSIQNGGAMALPDGKPLSIVSRMKGFKEAQRVTGPDLMGEIFSRSEKKSYKHYFYGSTEDTLNTLRKKLEEKYPGMMITGMHSPPFRSITNEEDKEIIRQINDCNPDFIWVGLGAPKQEIWMHNHKGKFNGVMIGVGAGFDYYAENIARAPKIMQDLGMEWFYRLLQDPKRLWKRYLVTNCKFIIYIIKEKGDKNA